MVDDPRDRKAYQIAIAFLGFAVVAAIGGIAWVAAEHKCVSNIPIQIWYLGGAVIGVFVGALTPFALRVDWSRDPSTGRPSHSWDSLTIVGGLMLVVLCGVAITLGQTERSLTLNVVAVTFGGVLLGLPIPSPGRRDP